MPDPDLSYRLDSSPSDENFKLSCEMVLSKLVPVDKSILDRILASNKSDQPEIISDDGQKYIWYFAIGSMINPISLYLRDLVPLMSYPATIQDHRIAFRGPAGMADIDPCPGANFDGVVHLLTESQMIHLDQIEMVYRRIPVTCINYDNLSQIAFAYKMKGTYGDSPPQERYLDIIVKGCEYYKVRPEYINHLRNDQPIVPRRKPEEFRCFNDVPENIFFSKEELQQHNAKDPTIPIWISINGKVLEYAGLPEKDHPDYESQNRFYQFVSEKLAGGEVAAGMAKALYEPLYKLPLNDDDISDAHRAHIEDSCFRMLISTEGKLYWKAIGRLRR